jgi:Leucine-rich repeat (LRR) protein
MATDDSNAAANNKGMEARIELEMRGKKPAEITDLLLDNCKATKISGLTGEFSKLSTLSLINVGLTSLEGLPKLEALTTIDLSDNKLTGDLDRLADNCPQLYHINLCANKIKDIDSLAPLKKLKQLSALDLFDCEVTEVDDYRHKVFELIPQLKYLDGFDINDVEHDDPDDDDDEEAEDGLDDEEDEPEPSDEEEDFADETG